jgi:hypothetical protein
VVAGVRKARTDAAPPVYLARTSRRGIKQREAARERAASLASAAFQGLDALAPSLLPRSDGLAWRICFTRIPPSTALHAHGAVNICTIIIPRRRSPSPAQLRVYNPNRNAQISLNFVTDPPSPPYSISLPPPCAIEGSSVVPALPSKVLQSLPCDRQPAQPPNRIETTAAAMATARPACMPRHHQMIL